MTMDTLTREGIRDERAGEAFPQNLLIGCKTALVLFAAGFFGKQDAFWVAEAGLTATCVDNDEILLRQMQEMYPPDWCFLPDDAYVYIVETKRRWDVVTVDCPSGHFARCAQMVDQFCRVAYHGVVLGTGINTKVEAPEGWEITDKRRRSDYDGGVFWTVLEPEGPCLTN